MGSLQRLVVLWASNSLKVFIAVFTYLGAAQTKDQTKRSSLALFAKTELGAVGVGWVLGGIWSDR